MSNTFLGKLCKHHPELNGLRYASPQHKCPACRKVRKTIWIATNKAQISSSNKLWRETNPGKNTTYNAAWRKKHPERHVASTLAWQRNNREKVNAKSAQYRANKFKAMPIWADKEEIKLAYAIAKRVSLETGIMYHVDHIVPLKSKIVCGLHVPANLQLLTHSANSAKCNKHWPNMPEDKK
jgi:hypothetical protein